MRARGAVDYEDEMFYDEVVAGGRGGRGKKRSGKGRKQYGKGGDARGLSVSTYEDLLEDEEQAGGRGVGWGRSLQEQTGYSPAEDDDLREGDDFRARVEAAVDKVRKEVAGTIGELAWREGELEKERRRPGSVWGFYDELAAAVASVSSGLIEREEEARLVVLGMVAQEHVLLLGPPGTGVIHASIHV